jgi:hypothetical protein
MLMSPEAAFECQLEPYRRMTGEERLAIALRMHEVWCETVRAGIRDQDPRASPEEVERLLHQQIELARELEKKPKCDFSIVPRITPRRSPR